MNENNNVLSDMGILAKEASYKLARLSSSKKNEALFEISKILIDKLTYILEANKKDVEIARLNGTKETLIDRLMLDEKRIENMAKSAYKMISLNDPIGEVLSMWKRPNGLTIGKKRVPLGVVGIIYEARPNVTLDAAVLCIKTGNAVVLRGGSEAINSNIAIVEIIQEALQKVGLPKSAVQIVNDTSRLVVNQMMKLNKYIDVLIPRGGAELIRMVVENSNIPVIETGVGNCHIYVEKSANLKMAEEVIINAKVSRPSVCNAAESLLIDQSIAKEFVPQIVHLLNDKTVEVRVCEKTLEILREFQINENHLIIAANEEDYYKEFLDLIISVKIVDDIDEAVSHINKYGSKHSEAIITSDYQMSQKFLEDVDAAAVYVNASTRFTDGEEFGFGAEIGISTQKLHARGPMGLNELTSTKYIIYGNGQTR